MQQLTELQEKWLKALESGEYKQGRRTLGDATRGYCCLGVACLVVEKPFSAIANYPPSDVWRALRLRDDHGRSERFFTAGPRNDYENLGHANDDGRTFAEIAAAIRANPENFFLPPEAP